MLTPERRWVWRTTPTIAARTIVTVSWRTPLEYTAEEVDDHKDPDFKLVEVCVGTEPILEFHCQLDADGYTSVESFRPSDLAGRLIVLTTPYLDEVERRARELRLPRPHMGYAR